MILREASNSCSCSATELDTGKHILTVQNNYTNHDNFFFLYLHKHAAFNAYNLSLQWLDTWVGELLAQVNPVDLQSDARGPTCMDSRDRIRGHTCIVRAHLHGSYL